MRMGRLIARSPFERAGISPQAEQHGSMAGQMRAIAGDDQQGPGFSIARGWPRVAIPSRRPRKVAIVTFKFGRRPLSTASPVVLNAPSKRLQ